jgi:hypothetical protein
VLVGESSAAVYTGFYPSEVAGLALVKTLWHSCSTGSGFSVWVRSRPAPAPPMRLTTAEWNSIWFLTHSSKAASALMQHIASWRLSSAEARASGGLGGLPLLALSAGNIAAPPEFH